MSAVKTFCHFMENPPSYLLFKFKITCYFVIFIGQSVMINKYDLGLFCNFVTHLLHELYKSAVTHLLHELFQVSSNTFIT